MLTFLIDNLAFWLLCVALLPAIWLLTAYRGRIASVGKAIRRETDAPFNPDPRPAPPAVSVIVVAGDDAKALESLLGKLFEQEYPSAEMEVIVVNDGKSEDVRDVVTRIKNQEHRPNLYITFTPAQLRNVSHRKLAVTLGIKAAHHPVVMLLTEQSRLYSKQWLARMAAPFADPNIELVLGSAMPAAKSDHGWGVRYRSFTHGADATEWLSAALRGKPWRGHRANLAFRRDLFFTSGGFNGALNLKHGDDDIFVSKLAKPGNTACVLAAQAHVRYGHPTGKYEFVNGRSARFYTSRGLGRGSRRLFAISSAMNWLLPILCIGSGVLAGLAKDWIVLGGAAFLLLLTWVVLSLTWRQTLLALRCRPALLALPWRMMRRPLTNFHHKWRARRRRSEYHNF